MRHPFFIHPAPLKTTKSFTLVDESSLPAEPETTPVGKGVISKTVGGYTSYENTEPFTPEHPPLYLVCGTWAVAYACLLRFFDLRT